MFGEWRKWLKNLGWSGMGYKEINDTNDIKPKVEDMSEAELINLLLERKNR